MEHLVPLFFITVFIGHHGDNDNSQEQLEECRDKGVKMPDIWEVKNADFCKMKFYRADIKLNGSDQGYRGQ